MAEATLSTIPKSIDTQRILEVRILNALRSATGGGGTGTGTGMNGIVGTGSPEGVQTANPGTIYYATDTGGFYVKATGAGNVGWIALII